MYTGGVTMIQIRNVPEDIHRGLKARAAMEGISLSDLALAELTRSLKRPTRRELLERVASRQAVTTGPASEDLITQGRTER